MRECLDTIERTIPGSLTTDRGRPSLIPASSAALGKLLHVADRMRMALEAPGAGSHPNRPELRLDRLDELISVDDASRILHVQAGMTLGVAEEHANDRGWTIPVRDAFHDEQVGAWLARGAPGRRHKDDDAVAQLVAGIELMLPSGRELTVRPAPRRAVGPDLIRAVIGARARLGVIVGIHLVASARVAESAFAFSFANERAATCALHHIRGAGVRPSWSSLKGNTLRLDLEAAGARGEAATSVMERIVAKLGGEDVRVDAVPDSGLGSVAIAESREVFERLADELDPNAILQP